jgi:hypothetical protein
MTKTDIRWIVPVFALALAACAASSFAASLQAERPNPEYATSKACAGCHLTHYKGWRKTFHGTMVRDAGKDPSAILGDLSEPDLPFRKEDIHYAIGGHWDQRYLTVLDNDYFILPRMWSVQSRKWREYSVYGWQRRPYVKQCIGCHAVSFDPATKQVAELSVGCEACHGPGAKHAASPSRENIVNPARLSPARSDDVCASCHVRGKDLSGEYFFPIGWKPGEALADYLVPLDRGPEESNDNAIRRNWEHWKSKREKNERMTCVKCGIIPPAVADEPPPAKKVKAKAKNKARKPGA